MPHGFSLVNPSFFVWQWTDYLSLTSIVCFTVIMRPSIVPLALSWRLSVHRRPLQAAPSQVPS